MDHKSLTLVRDKDKTIPDKVLEMALLNHGGFLSIALAETNEAGRPVISAMRLDLRNSEHKGGALGEVKDALEVMKDFKLLLHFTGEEADEQPFVLIKNEQNESALVVALDGDFSEDAKAEGKQTIEDAFANDYLAPKVQGLYEDKADGEMDKLVTQLQSTVISMELSKVGKGDHMTMIMLANNGQMPVFTRKKSPLVKYDWGHAAYDMEDKPKPAETPKVEEQAQHAKPTSALDRLKGKGQAPVGQGVTESTPTKLNAVESMADKIKRMKAEKKDEVATTVADAKVVHPPFADATKAKAKSEDPLLRVPIPGTFDGMQNRRKWFVRRMPQGTSLPSGWERMTGEIAVPLSIMRNLNTKKDDAWILARFPIFSAEDAKAALKNTTAPAPGPVNTSVPEAGKKDATSAEDHPLLIPKAHITSLRERFFSKGRIVALIDKKGDNIMDPALTAMTEDTVPPFWAQLELPNLEATLHWSDGDFKEMGQFSLDALAKATGDYKREVIKLRQELFKVSGKGTVADQAGLEHKDKAPDRPLTMKEKMEALRKKVA